MKHTTRYQLVRIWLIWVLVLAMPPCPGVAAERIVLVSSQDTKDSFYGRWLGLIYAEVFRRLGYEFKYEGYPGGRAPVIAEKGEVDGEIHRAIEYEKSAKNLLRVKEPSFTLLIGAYAVKPGITLHGWNSLKNTNYTVEYRRGSNTPEINLTTVVKPEKLSAISTTEQGLRKLIMGRTDIFVEQEPIVAETLKKLEKENIKTSSVYLAGIMYSGDSYVYLHKKHASLLPKISEALKDMKQKGIIERYKKIAEAR